MPQCNRCALTRSARLNRRLANSGARHGPAFDFAGEQDSPPYTLHSSFYTPRVSSGPAHVGPWRMALCARFGLVQRSKAT